MDKRLGLVTAAALAGVWFCGAQGASVAVAASHVPGAAAAAPKDPLKGIDPADYDGGYTVGYKAGQKDALSDCKAGDHERTGAPPLAAADQKDKPKTAGFRDGYTKGYYEATAKCSSFGH